MSLILDALKKLDRQKSRIRKGTDNFAASILNGDAPPHGKKWRFFVAAVFLTAAVTAVTTYLAVVGFDSGKKSPSLSSAKFSPSGEQVTSAAPEPGALKISPPAPEKSFLASREVPPAAEEPVKAKSSSPRVKAPRASRPQSEAVSSTAVPPPRELKDDSTVSPGFSQRVAISPSGSGSPAEPSPPASEVPIKKGPPLTPAPPPRETVRQIQSGKTEETPKIETHPGNIASTPAAVEKMADRKAIPEKMNRSPGIPPKSTETVVSGPPSSLPQLKISGIMWHDEPSKRRAVINGTFTNEGSTIEGMEVVEILPTKVRFRHQGRPFEISIFE
jgi:hypothetical protein